MAHACCFDQFAGQRRVSLVIRRQIRDDVRPIGFGNVLHRVQCVYYIKPFDFQTKTMHLYAGHGRRRFAYAVLIFLPATSGG